MTRIGAVANPDLALLIIDGTIGQQCFSQAEAFHKTVPVGGIIITKLDSSAKGGGALAAAAATGAQIMYIGTGERIGNNLGLEIISPLWHIDQKDYLQELLESGFKFIITSVTSAGLDQSWLGREITRQDVEQLVKLSAKHGFNLAFEGGEAETFVIDCPLFCSPIGVIQANKIWDGYRGRFEITEAILEKQC